MAGRETTEGSIYYAIESLGDDAATVQEFQNEIMQVKQTPPGVLNINDAVEFAAASPQKSLTQGCVDYVADKVGNDWNKRWYVDSVETADIMYGLHRVMVSRTSVAETSAHKVFFGKLTGAHHGVRVAIKPFVSNPEKKSNPEKVINEWVNMKLAQDRGLDVFQPLGFMLDSQNSRGYMVTLRSDGVEAMDNSNWRHILSFPERHEGQLADLKKIGSTLAGVHDRGCYHGDPQMKNHVITQSGSVHLIDWEAANFSYTGLQRFLDSATEAQLRADAVRDLKVIFGSLARPVDGYGVGLLSGRTPQAQFSYFKELVLDPYTKRRLILGEQQHGTDDEMLALLEHLTEVEGEITAYILANGAMKSLAQVRRNQA
jgi:tRNA A-37 threonylcarbamoyl transferase component Bud32